MSVPVASRRETVLPTLQAAPGAAECHTEIEAATEEILSNEGIRYQSSDSLRDVLENKE